MLVSIWGDFSTKTKWRSSDITEWDNLGLKFLSWSYQKSNKSKHSSFLRLPGAFDVVFCTISHFLFLTFGHKGVYIVLHTSSFALSVNPVLSRLLIPMNPIISFQLRSLWWPLIGLVIKSKLHVVQKAFNIWLLPTSLTLYLVPHPSPIRWHLSVPVTWAGEDFEILLLIFSNA